MDNKTTSLAMTMSIPSATMLDRSSSGNVENSKFTNSGHDTTYNVQNNYNIGVFSDVMGYIQTTAKFFVEWTRKNQLTVVDGIDSLPQAITTDHTPQSSVSEGYRVGISDIVPPDPSSFPVVTIADRYTRSMLECMVGYPLYEPHPFSQHSMKEYSHHGVNIGDVGFVREDGTFDFLFNICPPRNSLINPPNLPNGFSLETPEDSETRPMRPLARETEYFPRTVTRTATREYICESEGAVLKLPEGAIQDEAINKGLFEDLAKCHGVEWYEYTKARGRSISNGSLYLITSFVKCSQWGIAVFDRRCDLGQGLTFSSNPLRWTGLGALFTRVADPNQGDTPNQCVFLRGYKIMIRKDIFDNLPTRQRAHRIRGGGGTGFTSRMKKILTGESPLTRTTTPSVMGTDEVVLHASFNSSPVHPSDLINAELLNQNPDTKIALTHDDVWCDLLRDNFPKPNYTTLINVAQSYTSRFDERGCISLEKIPDSNNIKVLNKISCPFQGTKIPQGHFATPDKDNTIVSPPPLPSAISSQPSSPPLPPSAIPSQAPPQLPSAISSQPPSSPLLPSAIPSQPPPSPPPPSAISSQVSSPPKFKIVYPSRPQVGPDPVHNISFQGSKFARFGNLSFGKKNKRLAFGGDKSHHSQLPPVDETTTFSHSFPNHPQTSSIDKSMQESEGSPPKNDNIKKRNRKEAERLEIEAEKERRKLLVKAQREQARAIMLKRSQIMAKTFANDDKWLGVTPRPEWSKITSSGPIRQAGGSTGKNTALTVGAAAGRYGYQHVDDNDVVTERERVPKARRRDFDDDHSMSSGSSEDPPRGRNRPSLFGISRMASMHSLRASFDDFPSSARSSASYSLEGQLAHDFRMQASVKPSVSPPPMQVLTLHPHLEYGDGHLHPPGSYGPSPSSDSTPKSSKSAINPMFKVPPLKPPSPDHMSGTSNLLPPFSELEAVASGEYSLVSPMAFSPPSPERN